MKSTVLTLITWYQKTLSPDHGPRSHRYPAGYCRYYPSCSEYTRLAVVQRGVFVGLALGSWRVLRCNPFARPRVDYSHLRQTNV